MRKLPDKVSKPAVFRGEWPRATGLPPLESDDYKKFLEYLQSGERIKFAKPTDPPPEAVMAPLRLALVIRALREGKTIEPSTAHWLAGALEKALKNPAKSAEALGIHRKRGRPESLNDRRHLQLALDVHTLHVEKGLSMKDSKVGLDTASLISKVRHVSVRSVELAWEKWRGAIGMWSAFQASESKNLPAEKS